MVIEKQWLKNAERQNEEMTNSEVAFFKELRQARRTKTHAMIDRIKWNDMDTAPHDGRWLLLDIDDGSTDCVEWSASSIYVGRWNPKFYPETGVEYEWEVIDRCPDDPWGHGDVLTHWAKGRVDGWLPMPEPLTHEEQPRE